MKSAAGPKTSREDNVRAYARWRQAQSRYERLQAAFDSDACVNAAIRRGRYLRLCAQIALASEVAENARQELVTALENVGHPIK